MATLSSSIPVVSGAQFAPQIVVLLDDEVRVLSVNQTLAGKSFPPISADSDAGLHAQLHPGCEKKCRLCETWAQAQQSFETRDIIEWEVNDAILGRLLRLNLTRPPTPQSVEINRRQQYVILTITDITKYRQKHQSLRDQQQALIRLLISRNARPADSPPEEFDETGDTGNRIMADVVKHEQSIAWQIVQAQENERRRVAQDLHDGLAQSIGVVKYKIESGIADIARKHPDLDLSVLDGAIEDTKNLVEEIRRISSNLAPSVLEDFGIQIGLEWLCRECTVTVRCVTNIDEAETPDLVKVAIYRVTQEALNNVAKHARATTVEVSLKANDEGVSLVVADDGVGLGPKKLSTIEKTSGLGLRSMRERVEATGGRFTIAANGGSGVIVRAEWKNAVLDSILE
jgi:signal transduction histidine kinase